MYILYGGVLIVSPGTPVVTTPSTQTEKDDGAQEATTICSFVSFMAFDEDIVADADSFFISKVMVPLLFLRDRVLRPHLLI